jgi:hypothetical protein
MATSINDLRIAFWGGTDAEKATLEQAYAAGRSAVDMIDSMKVVGVTETEYAALTPDDDVLYVVTPDA